MKVLHVPFGFYPDAVGGTEVYVASLCGELGSLGVECAVAAPGRLAESYSHEGLRVRRFAADPGVVTLEGLYGDGDSVAAEAFAEILDAECPDVVHQHALTPACSVRIPREARRRGIRVVFTYHTPTITCHRGTLLEWGEQPCDGRLEVERCAACALQGLGTSRPLGHVLAAVPLRVGALIETVGLAGGAWTALRMSSLVTRHHRALNELFGIVDRFVALAPWVGALLRVNGVPERNIVYSRHGVAHRKPAPRPVETGQGPLRVAHLGRVDAVKGTGLLVRALRATDAAIELDVFGVVQGSTGADLLRSIQAFASDDTRIRFLPPIAHDGVVDRLSEYDLVAVPSQWMETGPLVVLEAFAAGVPVIGSALGGLADKITDGVDGLLVRPHDSVDAWMAVLRRCATEKNLVSILKHGVRPPRTMAAVASEMVAVYDDLVGHAVRATREAAQAQ